MKMKKWFLILVSILILVGSLLIHLTVGFPLVVGNKESLSIKNYSKGDTVYLLENCDFDTGDWTAYIVFNRDDSNRDVRALAFKVYRSDDIQLLKQMKAEWVFDCTGSDIATVQSEILFYQNGELKYRSCIVLDKGFEGFQSPQCGWISSKKEKLLYKYCKQFNPVHWPVVFL